MSNLNLVFLFAVGSLIMLAGHISQSYILDPASEAQVPDANQIEGYNIPAILGERGDSLISDKIGSDSDASNNLPLYVFGSPALGDDPCSECDGMTPFECKTICKEYGLKKSNCDGCMCICNN